MLEIVLYAAAVLAGLGIIFGLGLAIASKKLAVPVDERITKVRELLPGANCGGCGFPGCDGFAEAVVQNKTGPEGCNVCQRENIDKIAEIMGRKAESKAKKTAHIMCRGTECVNRAKYYGASDCRGAILAAGGFKACKFGCIGFGTCEKVCKFGAIKVGPGGFAEVTRNKCTGCGICAEACPAHIIAMMDDQTTYVACHNHGFGKEVISICRSGCIGCGVCEKVCPEKAIVMKENIPVIDPDKCVGCGICAEKCRPGCIIPQAKLSQKDETDILEGKKTIKDIS